MSDVRRRRKSEESGGSDDVSELCEELKAPIEIQKSEPVEAHRDSEYDTAGSDGESDGSQDAVQRESGDGQEEDKPQKKLDDDEDRRNPQYIPKRGTFYEHDDRTTEELVENAVEEPSERDTKEKKVWKDKEDKWNHDRYNDDEQAPKSHDELIAVYGYDIRNEEGPPRARRRRRYGRGPNKYTRNWEDEDAYGKTTSSNSTIKSNRRSNKTGEEFPALGGSRDVPEVVEEPVISSAWYSNKNKPQNKQNFPPLQSQPDIEKTKTPGSINTLTNENKLSLNEPTNPAWKKEAKYTTQSSSPNRNSAISGDSDKSINLKSQSVYGNKRQVQESVSLAASKARGRGYKPGAISHNIATSRIVDSKPKGRGSGVITGDPRRNNIGHDDDEKQLTIDMKHMNVHDGVPYHHTNRSQNKNLYARPDVAPPRIQPSSTQQQQPPLPQQNHQQQPTPDVGSNRPKRYSSLRQRPAIPEVPGQQQYPARHGQHGFYTPQGGNSHGVLDSQGFPPGHFDQAAPVTAAQPPLTAASVISLSTAGQPASYAPPPFLVPTPQFIASQPAPPIINYVPGPTGPTFQANFPAYPGFSSTVPPQGPPPPPELFQPQGCTYYNPAQQPPQLPQAPPVRRAKAAIPILPPPDNSQLYQATRGRGRSTGHSSHGISPGASQSLIDTEIVDMTNKIEEVASLIEDEEKVVQLEDEVLEMPENHLKVVFVPEESPISAPIEKEPELIDSIFPCEQENVVVKDEIAIEEVDQKKLEFNPIQLELAINDEKNDIGTEIVVSEITPSKTIEIEAAVTNKETKEVSKVENVVNQSPVVEETAA